MVIYLIEMFAVSLAITVVVELVVAYFLLRMPISHMVWKSHVNAGSRYRGVGLADDVKGTRGKWAVTWWLLVALVNVLTNLPAVLLCWLGRMYLPPGMHFPVQIAVEAAVIAVEAWVYRSFSEKPEWGIENPVLLSVAANGCSWLTGMLLMILRN